MTGIPLTADKKECMRDNGLFAWQETTHTRDLPEPLRRRIIEYFKYKYRDGKVQNQEEVMRELPYDMQVGPPEASSPAQVVHH